jgi:hypothetical protein
MARVADFIVERSRTAIYIRGCELSLEVFLSKGMTRDSNMIDQEQIHEIRMDIPRLLLFANKSNERIPNLPFRCQLKNGGQY